MKNLESDFDSVDYAKISGVNTILSSYLIRTPIVESKIYKNFFLKTDNLQLGGTFKTRGPLNLVLSNKDYLEKKTLVAATKGNFGIGLTYAAKLIHTEVYIFVPQNNCIHKNFLLKKYGAILKEEGENYSASYSKAYAFANQNENAVFIPTASFEIVLGLTTIFWEIFEQMNSIDVLLLPVGSGSLLAAAVFFKKVFNLHNLKIFALQTNKANAFLLSMEKNKIIELPKVETIVEALSTCKLERAVFNFLHSNSIYFEPVEIDENGVIEEFKQVLISENIVMELASFIPYYFYMKNNSYFRDKKTISIVTGGNIGIDYNKKCS